MLSPTKKFNEFLNESETNINIFRQLVDFCKESSIDYDYQINNSHRNLEIKSKFASLNVYEKENFKICVDFIGEIERKKTISHLIIEETTLVEDAIVLCSDIKFFDENIYGKIMELITPFSINIFPRQISVNSNWLRWNSISFYFTLKKDDANGIFYFKYKSPLCIYPESIFYDISEFFHMPSEFLVFFDKNRNLNIQKQMEVIDSQEFKDLMQKYRGAIKMKKFGY